MLKFIANADGLSRNKVELGGDAVAKGECSLSFWRESHNNTLLIGDRFIANNLKIVFKGHNCRLIIGNDVRLTGHILIVGQGREVMIGDRTTAQGVYILSRDANVTIGADCMLSREIEIRSTDVHKIYDRDSGERVNPAADVHIANNVWIAARAIVSKGASVAQGCVIGAAAFVNKAHTEEHVVLAGAPANIVKHNIRWER